jgi:hypothetical protein
VLSGFGDGLVVPSGDVLIVPCGALGFGDGVLAVGEAPAFGPLASVGPLALFGGVAVPLWVACWLIAAWHNMHHATALLPMIVKSFIAILLVKSHPPTRLSSNFRAGRGRPTQTSEIRETQTTCHPTIRYKLTYVQMA